MKIYTDTPEGATVIQNSFIDQYMPHANGEFVKVYLYLLRCANTGRELSLSSIADVFEHTEKDVQRALAYWEKQGLMHIRLTSQGGMEALTFLEPRSACLVSGSHAEGAGASVRREIFGRTDARGHTEETSGREGAPGHSGRAAGGTGTSGRNGKAAGGADTSGYTGGVSGRACAPGHAGGSSEPAGASGRSTPSAAAGGFAPQAEDAAAGTVDQLSPKAQKELRQLFFIAEQYLQRTLTASEQSDFVYYYTTLQFSFDLLEYLLEYCISKGSGSRHYMRRVALAWAEAGITTVRQAKQETNLYNKNYFTILNSFGIKGRNPAPPEQEMMARWLNEFGFSIDIILEACRRTICQTHQPNFSYADRILEKWHKNGVRSMKEIEELDRKRQIEQAQQKQEQQKKAQARPQKSSGNRFNNFSQREYDYGELERQLLKQQ